MANGIQMTLDEFIPMPSPQPKCGAQDSHVRTSQLQENSSDLLETAQACFTELCTWLRTSKKKKDPMSLSLRTLRICLALMEDGTSPDFSLKWTGGGMTQNGSFSTLPTSGYHSTESGCSLSDILEENPDSRYFLSKDKLKRIVWA